MSLLNTPQKLIVISLDLNPIVIRESTPPALGLPFDLRPFPLHLFLIHDTRLLFFHQETAIHHREAAPIPGFMVSAIAAPITMTTVVRAWIIRPRSAAQLLRADGQRDACSQAHTPRWTDKEALSTPEGALQSEDYLQPRVPS